MYYAIQSIIYNIKPSDFKHQSKNETVLFNHHPIIHHIQRGRK